MIRELYLVDPGEPALAHGVADRHSEAESTDQRCRYCGGSVSVLAPYCRGCGREAPWRSAQDGSASASSGPFWLNRLLGRLRRAGG
jgi:predicted amidophosphoribosyltransferase